MQKQKLTTIKSMFLKIKKKLKEAEIDFYN